MSVYKYKDILAKSKEIKRSVERDYEFKVTPRWCYYICKALLKPKTDFKGIGIKEATNPTDGTHISRQIKKADYLKMCENLVVYVEKNKQLPNYVKYKKYRVNINLFTYITAYLLVHYDKEGKLKNQVNVNSKYLIKPKETSNVVYDYYVQKTGLKPKKIDDVCDWVIKYITYLFYYDDQKSNKEVIDSKSGNCTDLLQFLVNMAEAMGYEWKVIHTQCRQSSVGHVYGLFRRKDVNGGEWFVRDIACIADESRYCIWCEVPTNGYKLAENPSWFLANKNR